MALYHFLSIVIFTSLATPVIASSTMCVYRSSSAAVDDLEFIGYGEVAMIQVSLPSGPRNLPSKSYKIMMLDTRTNKIHLIYRNLGTLAFLRLSRSKVQAKPFRCQLVKNSLLVSSTVTVEPACAGINN
jgi:hypothetical protein